MSAPAAARPDVLMTKAYPEWDMQPMAQAYTLHRLWEASDPKAFIAECAPRIRAIATSGERGADAALIAALPKLELIACYGVGVDAIDLDAARERGVRVTNTPDVLTGDVADLAIGMTLALLRRIPAAEAHVRSGAWAGGPIALANRVFGKRIGIAGFGRIGAAVARRFSGFDCEIGYFNRSPRAEASHRYFDDLRALAEWCDVLVVTVAGGAGTRAIVDADVLQALGPQGFIVNVSRGTTIDEPAMIDALQAGRIAGAGLDVFLNEPNIDPRFLGLTNVVLQPHQASATFETRRAMGQLVRDNLAAHFAGQPLLTPVV